MTIKAIAVEGTEHDIVASNVSGVVAVANGGTGATTAANALTNLGLTATAKELNYTDGVTSSIQTQLDGKAASSHSHAAGDITSGTLAVARGGTGVTSSAAIGLISYPIGAVYISYVSTTPATLFGGTWTAITGRFPYFNAGTSTGGSNTHTLTTAELPSHTHGWKGYVGGPAMSSSTNVFALFGNDSASSYISNGKGPQSVGSGSAHNNMPAYQTLYAWRRTA